MATPSAVSSKGGGRTKSDRFVEVRDLPSMSSERERTDSGAMTALCQLLWSDSGQTNQVLLALSAVIPCQVAAAQFLEDVAVMLREIEESGKPIEKMRATTVIVNRIRNEACPSSSAKD